MQRFACPANEFVLFRPLLGRFVGSADRCGFLWWNDGQARSSSSKANG